MQLSNKTKLMMSMAMATYLTMPLSVYANTGLDIRKEDFPDTSNVSIMGKYEVDQDASGVQAVVDTGFTESAGYVYGGYSENGNANNNTVTVRSDVTRDVVAGYSENGASNGNTVVMESGTVGRIYAAYGETVNNNTVQVTGGEFFSVTGVSGGSSAANNQVIVTGDSAGSDIVGAKVASKGTAINNKVYISGNATVKSVIGATTEDSGNISGNEVHISGGTFTGAGNIYGAYMYPVFYSDYWLDNNLMDISGGQLNSNRIKTVYISLREPFPNRPISGSLNNNKLTISGGEINTQEIYLVCIEGRSYDNYTGSSVAANNNIMTISGGQFQDTVKLYGAVVPNKQQSAANLNFTSSGNRLNIYRPDMKVASVDGFQIYDLALTNSGNPTLTITDALSLQAGDKIMSTRVLNELNVGDTVKVLSSTGGLTLTSDALVNGKAKQGALYTYAYELSQDASGVVVADILSKEMNKQTMSIADGQLAAMGMLRSGADLISGSAMSTAAQNANHYDVFAAMNYGNYHMNSVSNIDVQGTSMLVGMSRNLQHTNSNTTIGAFMESGWGTYDSELGEARAKGHTNYYGLGVLARHNQDSGIYTEGSLRVGKVGNTYSGYSADDGNYEASSTYYGLHLGIGKIHKLNDTTNIDYYGKYFYAHESGTDATLLGDKFDFDSIDSHRIRVGARLNNTNKNITRYVGLAYEYEFSGTAKASAYGMDIASPSAKGSSGLLELGLTYKPAADSRFSMDMGLTGYAGKRQGVSGNVNLNWAF